MAFKSPMDKDLLTNKILRKISSLVSAGEKVYYVNVHNVGEEYRIGLCSLEVIIGGWYTWYELTTYEDKNQLSGKATKLIKTELTGAQFEQIRKVLKEQWIKDGELRKERGLY